MKILGLSPKHVFSGFEDSFFDALSECNDVELQRHKVESKAFELMSILKTININKKRWGTLKDRHYHASESAFTIKSRIASKLVDEQSKDFDLIYQVGGLWNPILHSKNPLPLYLQVDYTTRLSQKRSGEWKRKPGREANFWLDAENKLFNQCEKILTTTDNARQSIIEEYGISANKVTTVGCGISPPYDSVAPQRSASYDTKKILFVGKGFKGKGLDVLLQAFSTVKKSIPDASLTIIGPTGLTDLPEGVNYLGRISDRDRVKEEYFKHSLFVMPSTNEPLGQVFLEAMSCKLPCIGTTIDAMPQIIRHGESGYVIDVGDHQQLSRHIEELLNNPEKLESMGENGFKQVCNEWLWPQVAQKIYQQLKN